MTNPNASAPINYVLGAVGVAGTAGSSGFAGAAGGLPWIFFEEF